MKTKYDYPKEGEWITPTRVHKLACCDCGLVHTTHFRIAIIERLNGRKHGKPTVQFRVWRDDRATAGRRRAKKMRAKIKDLQGKVV